MEWFHCRNYQSKYLDESGNFRGFVIMAGTPRKLEDVLLEQTEDALKDMNALVRFLARGRVKSFASAFEGLYEMTDEAAKSKKMGGGTTLYYFKEMGEHPVSEYLAACEKPMLVMQGEKDFQVKVDKDFAVYQELLAGKPSVTFKLYEDLNHAFVPYIYDSISQAKKEFATERHIGEEVIGDIANWIKGVVV